MSLLMEALRKAEEAKKKAAREAESKEAAASEAAEERQGSLVPEEKPENPAAGDLELSIEDIEDVPARSAVPSLDTPIEFEDEEDFVLPTSVGVPESSGDEAAASNAEDAQHENALPIDAPNDNSLDSLFDSEETADEQPLGGVSSDTLPPSDEAPTEAVLDGDDELDAQVLASLAAASADLDHSPVETEDESEDGDRFAQESEQVLPSIASSELPVDEEPEIVADKIDDGAAAIGDEEAEDSHFENEGEEGAELESESVLPEDDATEAPAEASITRVIVERPERTRERLGQRETTQQRAARNVFAAKRGQIFAQPKVQIAAGAGLFLLLVAVGTYFYISLNQESAFNIPPGTYVASEFVDDGNSVGLDLESANAGIDTQSPDTELSSTTERQDVEVASAVDAGIGLDSPEVADVTEEQLAAPDDSLPINADVDAELVSQSTQGAADIQPETLEQSQLDTNVATVTTIGDTLAPESELESIAEAETPSAPVTPAQSATQQGPVTGVADIGSAAEEITPEAQVIEPTNLISFRRQQTVSTVNPSLDSAYSAYQRGALDEAETLYRQVLADDPLQRDALLGLATIAARGGKSAEALDLYSRLLTRNPRDPIARVGLMELLPTASPANQEADLKRLLNDYPNVAALSYAQGNFLAANQRWSEAQQAYFRALQLAKADAAVSGQINPDYAFNLAVSLEHLNQREPAQIYYREALEFAANHPAGFDLIAVRTRLADLAGGGRNE